MKILFSARPYGAEDGTRKNDSFVVGDVCLLGGDPTCGDLPLPAGLRRRVLASNGPQRKAYNISHHHPRGVESHFRVVFLHSRCEALLTMFITKPASGDPLASAFPNTNHDHDSSLAWSIALTNGLFIALVVCVVGARMFTRAFKTKQVFADDCELKASSRRLTELPRLQPV